jgi:hypothetical protein
MIRLHFSRIHTHKWIYFVLLLNSSHLTLQRTIGRQANLLKNYSYVSVDQKQVEEMLAIKTIVKIEASSWYTAIHITPFFSSQWLGGDTLPYTCGGYVTRLSSRAVRWISNAVCQIEWSRERNVINDRPVMMQTGRVWLETHSVASRFSYSPRRLTCSHKHINMQSVIFFFSCRLIYVFCFWSAFSYCSDKYVQEYWFRPWSSSAFGNFATPDFEW